MASGYVISLRTIAPGIFIIQGALWEGLLEVPIVQSQGEEESFGNGGLGRPSKWIWFAFLSLGSALMMDASHL